MEPDTTTGHAPLIDRFGRAITYLRVSVTDRCDFRCVYCMAEDMTFLPKKDVLSLEELDRLCSAFVARGVRKLRLTGGEPLVRRNVMSLVRSLSRHLKSRRPRRADADHQRLAACPLRRGTGGGGCQAHQRLGRYPRSSEVQGDHPLGRSRQGDGWHQGGAGRRIARQDQCRGAEGRQRGRDRRPHPLDPRFGHGPDADRDDAARRDRRRPHRPVPAAERSAGAAGAALDA